MSDKERDRDKAGLHKKISSIFSGVLIPQKNSDQMSSGISTPEDTELDESQQQTPEALERESQNEILPEPEPAQESEPKLTQEAENKPVSSPKFMTAQESKVVPIEESEIDSPKDSEAEPIQETNVEPVQESEVELAQESENESVTQSEPQTTEKPKVIAVQRFQKADTEDLAKKVSKKSSVVKVSSKSSWRQITSKLFEAKPGASTTKQKAMVAMMPILFIVLIAFVIKGGVFGTSVHRAQDGDENNTGVVSAGLNDQIDWEIPEPYPTTLRDPMQLGPVVTRTNQTETKELVQLIVKSILYSEDNSSAIISNRIVHEGEQIQGARIAKINKDSVEFELNGKKWSQEIQR